MPLWKKRREPEAQELADRLDQLGLFEHLDAAEAQRAKEAFARDGLDALWRLDLRRSAMVGDAEDLAEGGIGEFLEELRPHLVERGVDFGEVEDVVDEDTLAYDVRVGDEVHTIYGPDAAQAEMARVWGIAWVRGFEILNGLLERAGSRERAYTMPEWDVWFLTPEQFDAVRAAVEEPRSRPYLPVDEHPWYGADH
jgi:hypothetical protein